MKRIFFILLTYLLAPFCWIDYNGINGKRTIVDGVSSFCTDGKTWKYKKTTYDLGKHEVFYTYVVRGDTIVGGKAYKKFYRYEDGTEQLAFMMREDGCKVFKLKPHQEEKLFFDYGREDTGVVYQLSVEEYDEVYNWMINAIDTIEVNNRLFRRYCCYQTENLELGQTTIEDGLYTLKDYWVLGIGSAWMGIESYGSMVVVPDAMPDCTVAFLSCYENGEILFTADDFTKPAYTTKIRMAMNNGLNAQSFFDLQGRRLSGKPAKGVYIENGRKRVK